jgi:apolipoprotein N-acyltransferase
MNMASVTFDKAQRERAKREGKFLICLSTDGRYAKKSGMTMHMIVNESMAKEVDKLMLRLTQKLAAKGQL